MRNTWATMENQEGRVLSFTSPNTTIPDSVTIHRHITLFFTDTHLSPPCKGFSTHDAFPMVILSYKRGSSSVLWAVLPATAQPTALTKRQRHRGGVKQRQFAGYFISAGGAAGWAGLSTPPPNQRKTPGPKQTRARTAGGT